jgi:DNA-directed RNA polymerase subunit N (RpoN/RPB10)
MLYLVCSCGEILGNKQLVYEEEMKKACYDFELDYNMVSKGMTHTEEYKKRMQTVINKLTQPERICCRQALLTYVDVVQIVK